MVERRFSRKRYIAFRFEKGGDVVGRRILANAIADRLARAGKNLRFEIIFIRDGKGIILTSNREARDLRELLNSFTSDDYGFEIRTLGTSGTILTLKQKFFRGQDLS
ncbi:MAG: hypothetical protein QW505_06240 [Thermoplasmata archaeon]